MDSIDFDEFEFKPLTEGLGFHKKPTKLEKPENKVTEPTERPISAQFRLNKDFIETATEPQIRQPLPRSKNEPVAKAPLSKEPILKGPLTKAPPSAPAVPKAKPALQAVAAPTPAVQRQRVLAINLGAAFVDGILVLALGIIFLVALLVVTKVDLMTVLLNTEMDVLTQLSLFALFLTVLQLYMVASRSFFGCSVGDWAFDARLGTREQQSRWYYPFQVLWRSLLVSLTGVIVLPLLSALFRRDIAAYLTGLQLHYCE